MMNLEFSSVSEFTGFKESVRLRLAERKKKRVIREDAMPAAVMMLLINKNNEAYVFLTRRTQKVRTHKGQVSFPGGARENGEDLKTTALRETFEETGIRPEQIEVIGEFDEYLSISDFHVSTFIGVIDYPYECRLNKDEIDVCFEAPLSLFTGRLFDNEEHYKIGAADLVNYTYNYEGFTIWGLTARILTEFAAEVLL